MRLSRRDPWAGRARALDPTCNAVRGPWSVVEEVLGVGRGAPQAQALWHCLSSARGRRGAQSFTNRPRTLDQGQRTGRRPKRLAFSHEAPRTTHEAPATQVPLLFGPRTLDHGPRTPVLGSRAVGWRVVRGGWGEAGSEDGGHRHAAPFDHGQRTLIPSRRLTGGSGTLDEAGSAPRRPQARRSFRPRTKDVGPRTTDHGPRTTAKPPTPRTAR
ncbi:hypothetical protein Hsar01_02901 [Haloferula sargassicola]|uniref:Uncharacterized protein n=1 Tax=Haloferula sargassicola TaxID=490096 RepID=A0ABP9USK5_9BACT